MTLTTTGLDPGGHFFVAELILSPGNFEMLVPDGLGPSLKVWGWVGCISCFAEELNTAGLIAISEKAYYLQGRPLAGLWEHGFLGGFPPFPN